MIGNMQDYNLTGILAGFIFIFIGLIKIILKRGFYGSNV